METWRYVLVLSVTPPKGVADRVSENLRGFPAADRDQILARLSNESGSAPISNDGYESLVVLQDALTAAGPITQLVSEPIDVTGAINVGRRPIMAMMKRRNSWTRMSWNRTNLRNTKFQEYIRLVLAPETNR